MRSSRLFALPVLLHGDARMSNVQVREVDGLPYGFIFEAALFRRNISLLNFSPSEGFRPARSAPWVLPLAAKRHAPTAASPLCRAREQYN